MYKFSFLIRKQNFVLDLTCVKGPQTLLVECKHASIVQKLLITQELCRNHHASKRLEGIANREKGKKSEGKMYSSTKVTQPTMTYIADEKFECERKRKKLEVKYQFLVLALQFHCLNL